MDKLDGGLKEKEVAISKENIFHSLTTSKVKENIPMYTYGSLFPEGGDHVRVVALVVNLGVERETFIYNRTSSCCLFKTNVSELLLISTNFHCRIIVL